MCAALFLICALLSHSLDNCASHPGGFSSDSKTQRVTKLCANGAGPCAACSLRRQESPRDVCDLLSEAAILTSPRQAVDHRSTILPVTFASVPATPQLFAPSGCLHGLAGPPPTPFLASSLRASVPNRAPPVLA
jgi:hypothetical protein